MAVRQRKPLVVPEASTHPLFDKPIFRQFAKLDIYAKTSSEVQKKTEVGGIVSLLAITFIACLVLIEVHAYVAGTEAFHDQLSVDVGVTSKVPVNFDVTFPSMQCQDLSLDLLDSTGAHQENVQTDIYRSPVDKNGHLVFEGYYNYVPRYQSNGEVIPLEPKFDPASEKFCGRCYVEPKHHNWISLDRKGGVIDKHISNHHAGECCNSCEDVMKMYDRHRLPRPHMEEVEQCLHDMFQKNPGCNLRGTVYLQKVKGNFHFAPSAVMENAAFKAMTGHLAAQSGKTETFQVFDLSALRSFNASHIIEHLSFGSHDVTRINKRGVVYPLDGTQVMLQNRKGLVKYFIKIVPTAYQAGSKQIENSYEFAVNSHSKGAGDGFSGTGPGVYFVYDFHPIKILHKFKRQPFMHFLVKISGLIGGLFVVTGMLDAILGAALAIKKRFTRTSTVPGTY